MVEHTLLGAPKLLYTAGCTGDRGARPPRPTAQRSSTTRSREAQPRADGGGGRGRALRAPYPRLPRGRAVAPTPPSATLVVLATARPRQRLSGVKYLVRWLLPAGLAPAGSGRGRRCLACLRRLMGRRSSALRSRRGCRCALRARAGWLSLPAAALPAPVLPTRRPLRAAGPGSSQALLFSYLLSIDN